MGTAVCTLVLVSNLSTSLSQHDSLMMMMRVALFLEKVWKNVTPFMI